MESTKNEETIEYDDVEKIRGVLVGAKIVVIAEKNADNTYAKEIHYGLSNGVTLKAHATDGGCACSNGCFTVDLEEDVKAKLLGATILAVQIEEAVSADWGDNQTKLIVNGEGESPREGSAEIKIFVYTDLTPRAADEGEEAAHGSRLPLVTSNGGDNGYYGWGFNLSVDRTIVVAEGTARESIEGAQ